VSRRAAFWLVLGLVGLIMVPVLSAVVFSVLDEDGVFGVVGSVDDEVVAYFTVFGLVFLDAIVPVFPGETTLTTASVAASDGTLQLAPVIVAGALGAILGDSALYWIARTGPKRLKARLDGASKKDERVASGLDLLGRSGPLLIACGRFVPGVRFAVNVMMGMTEYPYRRFLLFSAIGGTAWAIYTCVLAYLVSTALADFALASIVISGLITSFLVGAVYWIDRRRRIGGETSPIAAGKAS
jgi:membrane protein DedA with SNARE-associated domain